MARFEAFWDVACDYRQFIWLGVQVCLFLFILAVISLLLVEPGTSSQLLAIVNFVLILLLGSVVSWMYWVCVQRAREPY